MKVVWNATACARCGRYVSSVSDAEDTLCPLCSLCGPQARPRDQLRRLFRLTARRNAQGRVVYVRE